MILLTLLAACRHDPDGERPGADDTAAPDTLLVESISPGYATTLGGGEAEILGGPFDGSARVWLGVEEAEVLEAHQDRLVIEVPELDLGLHDLVVETDLGEGELLRALEVFEDASGLAGTFGAIEWYELQGSYWTDASEDFGTTWWGLIEPDELHYWDLFGVEEDACVSMPEFPTMGLMDLGVEQADLEVEGHSFTLGMGEDRFFDGALEPADYVSYADYAVPTMTGGLLPEFGIDHLASTPGSFDLYSPDLYGSAPPELAKNELDIEWGQADADRILILVERLDEDLEEVVETVGCVARNDGSFKVPGSVWQEEWAYDEWLYIYVGAAKEAGGTVPLNNADSRVAGVYWLLGAAVTTK